MNVINTIIFPPKKRKDILAGRFAKKRKILPRNFLSNAEHFLLDERSVNRGFSRPRLVGGGQKITKQMSIINLKNRKTKINIGSQNFPKRSKSAVTRAIFVCDFEILKSEDAWGQPLSMPAVSMIQSISNVESYHMGETVFVYFR